MRVLSYVKRFDWLKAVTIWVVGAVGTALAVVAAAQNYLGMRLVNALLVLLVVAVAGLSLLLSAVRKDVDDDLDQLQTDVNQGFDRVVDALDAEPDDARADGGDAAAEPTRSRDQSDPLGPTGVGALWGMLAGASVGTAFGAVGILVAGLVGFLLGNEIEYQDCRRKSGRGVEK